MTSTAWRRAVREALEQPGRRARRAADPPRAAQPHRLALAPPHRHRGKAHGDPVRRGRDPRRPRRSWACRRTRRSGSPTRYATSTAAPSRAGRRSGPPGPSASPPGRATAPTWDAAQAGHGLPGWAEDLPALRGGHPAGDPARHQPVHRRHGRRASQVWWPDRPTSPGTTGCWSRAPRYRRGPAAGGIAGALRDPRARHGLRDERHGGARRRAAGGRAPSSSSPTTCGRRSGWPRSAGPRRSTRGPTTPSDWVEDGPTHQPIEHLASLRAMPGLSLVRPADANETAQAWRLAVEADGPVGLVLTRQDVPVLAETADRAAEGVAPRRLRPGRQRTAPPEIVLVGSGSEVQLCLAAATTLARLGRAGAGGVLPALGPLRGSRTRTTGRASSRPGCPC